MVHSDYTMQGIVFSMTHGKLIVSGLNGSCCLRLGLSTIRHSSGSGRALCACVKSQGGLSWCTYGCASLVKNVSMQNLTCCGRSFCPPMDFINTDTKGNIGCSCQILHAWVLFHQRARSIPFLHAFRTLYDVWQEERGCRRLLYLSHFQTKG